MSNPSSPSDNPSEDMTPEQKAIIARARRFFIFTMALLLVGFIAIAGTLVYRASRTSGSPADGYALGEITLPAGAEVISIVPSQGMVAVTYKIGGVTQLRLIDGKTGKVLKDISTAVK